MKKIDQLRWLLPKRSLKITHFALAMSLLILFLFHYPFYAFVFSNTDYGSLSGIGLIVSLIIVMLAANALVCYILFSLSRRIGKVLLVISLLINATALYFINTYGIIIDESMIGNLFNTNAEESGSFFSISLLLYILFLGILPAIYVIKSTIEKVPVKKFIITTSLTVVFLLALAFANAGNWLWIDKNSKTLGGLAMPWSYSVNTSLFYIHKHQKNRKEILLPDAKIKDERKSVMVLVIGESARRANFSLYGYDRNTNPLLSKTSNLFHFDATSCATYTTAGVKCILEHAHADDLYEILPNYLYRNGVEVIWRTTNWGEPPIHIEQYENREALRSKCNDERCSYDEVLLEGLKEQVRASTKNKILIVLHTATSHGPAYSKKYPPQFEAFKPVCNSVEPGNCSSGELINAYDNTIVYTDYILYKVIENLKELKHYNSAMIFVSDHGESLGEKNLYMHGMPISIAPKEQYEIPFLVWVSDSSKHLKPLNEVSQNHVFHSTLNFLGVKSPVYDEDMNIFKD